MGCRGAFGTDVFGFVRENIIVLKDDGTSTDPTRENIVSNAVTMEEANITITQIDALKNLVHDTSEGDQLVFHCTFSLFDSEMAVIIRPSCQSLGTDHRWSAAARLR